MNFINKVNKYLLEHHPLIWNTRLVWMIGANILVHILFFFYGFLSLNELQDLKDNYNLSNFFFDSSAVYYNFLISIVIILIWIIFYLRNNAFKNTYHLPKLYLFKQFCIILCIFFLSVTQYLSFKQGLITKVKMTYDWAEVDKDIKNFNKAAIFLIKDQSDYEISNKQYPNPFPLKVAYSDNINPKNRINIYDDDGTYIDYSIDVTKSFIVKDKLYYQFYKVNEKLWQEDLEINVDLSEYTRSDFKYRIVKDISEFKELIEPSLLNYSKELFATGQDSLAYRQQLKSHQTILEKADETEIKNQLSTFLSLAKKYEISHNLDLETWFGLIYNTPHYKVNLLFNQSPTDVLNKFSNTKSRYYKDIPYSENLYVSLGNTDSVFKNIYEAYFTSLETGIIYFFIGLAYFFSLIVFIFKTTSIKNVLLSIVSSIVLLIIVIWLMSSMNNIVSDYKFKEYIVLFCISIMLILSAVLSYVNHWQKIVSYILWSLSLFAAPVFTLISCQMYIRSEYLDHKQMYPKDLNYKSNFENWFSNYGFWLVLLVAFMAVYIYSNYIRKLRARPE